MTLRDDRCPKCGSENVSASAPEGDVNVVWCTADCADCKCEWRWCYSLTSVEILQAKVEED